MRRYLHGHAASAPPPATRDPETPGRRYSGPCRREGGRPPGVSASARRRSAPTTDRTGPAARVSSWHEWGGEPTESNPARGLELSDLSFRGDRRLSTSSSCLSSLP